jgi:hypothetical protein
MKCNVASIHIGFGATIVLINAVEKVKHFIVSLRGGGPQQSIIVKVTFAPTIIKLILFVILYPDLSILTSRPKGKKFGLT